MKFTWQESDIQLGREVVFAGNESLIIGYIVGEAHKKRNLIHLGDGAVYRSRTVAELVHDLNAGDYVPRYLTTDKRSSK